MFRLIHIPILWTMAAVVVADAPAKVESPPLNVETNPMRYLENECLKFGINLVTYLGDKPFTGAPLTTVVDKGDGKGWPWSRFLATEQWCALVNRDGNGVGLYQPETARMCGGFAGGDDKKGSGGPHDVQTGYISPLARRILDHNIDWTYRTHIVAGSLEEILEFAAKQPRRKPAWNFDADRDGWHYEHAADTGWPIRGGLDISFAKAPRGTMVSDERLWHAEDAAKLEIEAAFHPVDGASTLTAEAVIQPFGRDDATDFHSWAAEQSKEAMAEKMRNFPPAKPLTVPFEVQADGVMRIYQIPLSGSDGYCGAMKQLRLRFPAADGKARVRRIALVR